MKTFSIIMKIVLALAVVAGIVFVIVKYGDAIVAWFKKTFGGLFSYFKKSDLIKYAPGFDDDDSVIAGDTDFES